MSNKTDCENRRETIVAFILGELEASPSEELQQHIEICQTCRPFYRDLLEEEETIQSVFKRVAERLEVRKDSLTELLGKRSYQFTSLGRMRNPITKLAAAAVIIVGIALLAVIVHRGPGEGAVPMVVKSPTTMMTAMSLTMAYRRGGIDAVEKQCERYLEMLGQRPASLTARQLLTKTNGQDSERIRL